MEPLIRREFGLHAAPHPALASLRPPSPRCRGVRECTECAALDGRDLRARRQRPGVAGLMSKPSVAENVAPHRPERNPKGLLPGLATPPGMAPRSPVST